MANGLFGGGDGTKGDPYLIEDSEDLNAVRNIGANHYFKQVADIDLSAYNWIPLVSSPSNSFFSSYDGGNFFIENLTMSGEEQEYGGLFSYCVTQDEDGPKNRLENISLKNVSIELQETYRVSTLAVGLINMEVINCHVQGSVLGGSNVGGFTQQIVDSIVDQCSINGIVKGELVGGFTCYMSDSMVSNCYVNADIYGIDSDYNYLGGFGYQTYSGTIKNCYILVDMNSNSQTNSEMYMYSSVFDTFYKSCYADITRGVTSVKWLEGANYYSGAFARGTDGELYENIEYQRAEDFDYWEDDWDNTGPPAWWPPPFTRAKPITGDVWNEYWKRITPANTMGARYTSEMIIKENYIGWDFENIWGISPDINNGYPYLLSEISVGTKGTLVFAKIGGVWIKSTDVYGKVNKVWNKGLEVFGKDGTWNKSE